MTILKRKINFLVRRTPNHAVMVNCTIKEEREIIFNHLKPVLGTVPDYSDLQGKIWPKTRTELRHEIMARLRAVQDLPAVSTTATGTL
jgi:hypothetical protein